MLHPAVYNTSALCHHLAVQHAVMSPGSRNAPLTISFARNEKIKKWIIPDERSAGFIALGIAQMTKQPVVLCCTSGTALLNYAPAIAEAFYREIPLIVISADRPPHLIDQRDGQTIRQFEVLKNHVKCTVQLPLMMAESDEQSYYQPIISAIRLAEELPKGPVHINIPFEEPFYPTVDQQLAFSDRDVFQIPAIDTIEPKRTLSMDVSPFKKIMILVGQHPKDGELSVQLHRWKDKAVVIKSPLNNLTGEGITYADAFIKDDPAFQPDLLITSGLSVLSKNLKQFIRKRPPRQHWHFDPAGVAVDTYQTNPRLIKASLVPFLQQNQPAEIDETFLQTWKSADEAVKTKLAAYSFDMFSEAAAFHTILNVLPSHTHVHLGNSMPCRYSELLGIHKDVHTWCNRGTSGIDGISSTAVGSALVSDELHILISGDVSFLYDRNAFFHNYPLANLRIIVINNQGGGIFRLIDGPSRLPELEDYFETRHYRTAEFICLENGIGYHPVKDADNLNNSLKDFFDSSEKPQLIEVFVDPMVNERVYTELRKTLKGH
jgi:2-succinyl-5-enolpyruvyl-6-hydroxy-3-cyclohexene-1-carboxylate synthase